MPGRAAESRCAGPENASKIGGRSGAAAEWSPSDVVAAAQLACVLEASAEKPGNVTPTHDFADLAFEDFVHAGIAIGPPLGEAASERVGTLVLRCVERSRRVARGNANLGIVLLLAPLARAALLARAGEPLRERLRVVLAQLDVDDARDAFAAIRLAAPGGLGDAAEQDVHAEPTVGLLEAMRLGAARDGVAAEYASAFATTFELALPCLRAALADGLAPRPAIVELHVTLLAAAPDTHVARRAGADVAAEVSRGAAAALAAGGVRTARGRRALAAFDTDLRRDGHARNPGTTADLVAAALFAGLLEGTVPGVVEAPR